MDEGGTLAEKQEYLRSELRRSRSVEFKKHPVDTSLLEAVFSRGDRRLSGVLKAAWDKGARFESWGDHMNTGLWQEAFVQQGVSPEDYWKEIDTAAVLPWDHIDTGIRKSHLRLELGKALEGLESPSCYETTCAKCEACDLPELKIKNHDEKIRVKPGGAPRIGKRSDVAERYLAFFSKKGPARFLSHIDLIHVLQRAFRRAGVTVLQSQGFHPKMLVSYAPALALGMEGREEPLEFRSAYMFEEKEFVGRMNRSLPEGIRILNLLRLDAAAPSLNRNLTGIVYSLDLKDPGIEPADAKTTKALIAAYEPKKPEGVALALEWKRRRLFITVPILPGKSPRPQDIAQEMFGIKNAVYALTRERFIFLS
jgi:radical SAM-linked protein